MYWEQTLIHGAVPAVAENKEANQIVDETFDMVIGNIIDDKEIQDQAGYEKYDIVTANILADVLIPLTPVIVNQMKKGAYYITSGILDVKEEVVVEAVKSAGLTVVEVTHQGEVGFCNSKKGLILCSVFLWSLIRLRKRHTVSTSMGRM